MNTTYKLLQKWLAYLFICFALVVVTITIVSVVWDYREIEVKAIKNLKAANAAIESELIGELEKYDKRLLVLIDQMQKNQVNIAQNNEVLSYWVHFSKIYNQPLVDYFYIEPSGKALHLLQNDKTDVKKLLAPSFIQNLFDSSAVTMSIGKTMANPWNPTQKVIPLTRKLYRGAKFMGVVGSLVPIDFYQKFIHTLELPENSVSALIHLKVGILATYPENYVDSKSLLSNSASFKEKIKSSAKGYFVSAEPRAGKQSLVYYSHFSEMPIYIVVARDYAEIFSSWEDGLWFRVITTLFTFLFLICIYHIMMRQISHIEEQDQQNNEYNRQLRQLVQTTSRVTGEEFFKTLSKQFHDTTGFRYICISTILELEHGKVRTIVYTDNGIFLENLIYDLKDTPCELTLKNGMMLYSSDLKNIFPNDPYLKNTDIESYVGAPLKNSQGKVIGIIAVLDDKPMKNADMIRSLLMVFAARAGAEMERLENEKLRGQLEQAQFQYSKMEALGRLAGGMAHDFNNILMMLFGNIDRIRQQLPEESPVIRYLDKMEVGTLRAKGIVQQTLAFSRKQEPKKEPVDVRKNIEEVCSLFSEIIPANIELQLDLQGQPQILGDSTQFHQILTNICSNSIYAMRGISGALKIQMSSINPASDDMPLKFTAGRYVKVEISDCGEGISKDHLRKIFDPFFTTKPIGEGTGLGLSVVHGILQSWNGHIKIHSELGKGTSTQIFLPELVYQEIPLAIEPVLKATSGVGKRALVIDDEEDLVEITCLQLAQEGIRSKGFTRPQEALIEFQKNPSDYDFIISDVSMPGIDGIQLMDKIQEVRSIPVIFTTGNYLSLQVNFTFSSEVRILEKPYQFQELVKTIDSLS